MSVQNDFAPLPSLHGPRDDTVRQLMQRGDWNGLAQHFAANMPRDAHDFQARALLGLHRPNGGVDWKQVLADLRLACTMNPEDPFLRANMAQALLDAGQGEEAYREALFATTRWPSVFPVLEKLGFAAAATQRWDEAAAAMERARAALPRDTKPADASLRLYAELQLQWWKPVTAGSVVLQLPQAEHAAFIESAFGNAGFMQHYHRFQAAGAEAVRRFIDAGRLSPLQRRRIDWVVLADGRPAGFAGLVDLDWLSRRGEILIGFPATRAESAALRASVAVMVFAFRRLRLEKMVSYVYADNPGAQSNTLHLGFRQEGLLRSHIASGTQRVDVHVNGLLRQEFEDNAMLQRLVRRWNVA